MAPPKKDPQVLAAITASPDGISLVGIEQLARVSHATAFRAVKDFMDAEKIHIHHYVRNRQGGSKYPVYVAGPAPEDWKPWIVEVPVVKRRALTKAERAERKYADNTDYLFVPNKPRPASPLAEVSKLLTSALFPHSVTSYERHTS